MDGEKETEADHTSDWPRWLIRRLLYIYRLLPPAARRGFDSLQRLAGLWAVDDDAINARQCSLFHGRSRLETLSANARPVRGLFSQGSNEVQPNALQDWQRNR